MPEKLSTKELVEELKKREGVKTEYVEPYQDKKLSVNGPATQSIQDKETYNKNKKEIRAQVAAFQEAVWDMQDSMEEADSTTGEDTTDETQE